jgi:hypothetical protein
MDPITLALVAALSSGVAEGLMGASVTEAYQALRARLSRKLGSESPAMESVLALEKQPLDAERAQTLSHRLSETDVIDDSGFLELAQRLTTALGTSGQFAVGSYIAQADHHGSASVNTAPASAPRDEKS